MFEDLGYEDKLEAHQVLIQAGLKLVANSGNVQKSIKRSIPQNVSNALLEEASKSYGTAPDMMMARLITDKKMPRLDAVYHYPFADDVGHVANIMKQSTALLQEDAVPSIATDIQLARRAKKTFNEFRVAKNRMLLHEVSEALQSLGLDDGDNCIRRFTELVKEKCEDAAKPNSLVYISLEQWMALVGRVSKLQKKKVSVASKVFADALDEVDKGEPMKRPPSSIMPSSDEKEEEIVKRVLSEIEEKSAGQRPVLEPKHRGTRTRRPQRASASQKQTTTVRPAGNFFRSFAGLEARNPSKRPVQSMPFKVKRASPFPAWEDDNVTRNRGSDAPLEVERKATRALDVADVFLKSTVCKAFTSDAGFPIDINSMPVDPDAVDDPLKSEYLGDGYTRPYRVKLRTDKYGARSIASAQMDILETATAAEQAKGDTASAPTLATRPEELPEPLFYPAESFRLPPRSEAGDEGGDATAEGGLASRAKHSWSGKGGWMADFGNFSTWNRRKASADAAKPSSRDRLESPDRLRNFPSGHLTKALAGKKAAKARADSKSPGRHRQFPFSEVNAWNIGKPDIDAGLKSPLAAGGGKRGHMTSPPVRSSLSSLPSESQRDKRLGSKQRPSVKDNAAQLLGKLDSEMEQARKPPVPKQRTGLRSRSPLARKMGSSIPKSGSGTSGKHALRLPANPPSLPPASPYTQALAPKAPGKSMRTGGEGKGSTGPSLIGSPAGGARVPGRGASSAARRATGSATSTRYTPSSRSPANTPTRSRAVREAVRKVVSEYAQNVHRKPASKDAKSGSKSKGISGAAVRQLVATETGAGGGGSAYTESGVVGGFSTMKQTHSTVEELYSPAHSSCAASPRDEDYATALKMKAQKISGVSGMDVFDVEGSLFELEGMQENSGGFGEANPDEFGAVLKGALEMWNDDSDGDVDGDNNDLDESDVAVVSSI